MVQCPCLFDSSFAAIISKLLKLDGGKKQRDAISSQTIKALEILLHSMLRHSWQSAAPVKTCLLRRLIVITQGHVQAAAPSISR